MAPQLDTVAGLISVSQHFWPTEPDKATVFPAVAAAGWGWRRGSCTNMGQRSLLIIVVAWTLQGVYGR